MLISSTLSQITDLNNVYVIIIVLACVEYVLTFCYLEAFFMCLFMIYVCLVFCLEV